MTKLSTDVDPPWLKLATQEIGQSEIPGSRDNAEILSFYADAGHPEIKDEDVAWCAAFCGAMLKRSGIKPSGSLLARSYLDWGKALSQPKHGCVTVLWRGSPDAETGHVGLLVAWDATTVTLLGGNQGDKVCTSKFPRDRVLGFRWPVEPAAPQNGGAGAAIETATAKPLKTIASPIGLEPSKTTQSSNRSSPMQNLAPLFPLIEQFAPTIGQLVAGQTGAKMAPLAVGALHALADALGFDDDEDRSPAAVAARAESMPTSGVVAGLQRAEAAVKAQLPQASVPAAQQAPAVAQPSVQDSVARAFTDAGVTNPTVVMLGSIAIAAGCSVLVNRGLVSADLVQVAIGGAGALIASATAVWHSWRSNANTIAMTQAQRAQAA